MQQGEDGAWVQLATRIPRALQRKLRLHCVTTETSVMNFVTIAIREKLAASSGAPVAAHVKGYSRTKR
jgi:hypothetical protein